MLKSLCVFAEKNSVRNRLTYRLVYRLFFATLGAVLFFSTARAGPGVGTTAAGVNRDCEKIVNDTPQLEPAREAQIPPLCRNCPQLVYTSYTETHSRVHFGHALTPESVIHYRDLSIEQKASVRLQIAEIAREHHSTSIFPPGVSARDVIDSIVPGPEWREMAPSFATRAMEGPVSINGKTYRVRVVFPNSSVRRNRIISIIPICGPDVMRVRSKESILHSDISDQPAYVVNCP